jgi:hypothetical protein
VQEDVKATAGALMIPADQFRRISDSSVCKGAQPTKLAARARGASQTASGKRSMSLSSVSG